jgi:hypothetical protein
VGFLLLFKIQQWSIRTEMDKEHRNIETLYIPHSYFKQHRIRDGKEIIWQGKMYDIKWSKLKNGVMIVKAIYDAKEHTLISKFTKHIQKQHRKDNNSSNTLSKILKFEYLPNLALGNPEIFTLVSKLPTRQNQTHPGYLTSFLKPPQTA